MSRSTYEINIDSVPADIKKNVWCKLVPTKELPDSRVGHTALYNKKEHKVILVGGATPHSLYNEVWVLNLQNLTSSRVAVLGDFKARYEHSAFMPATITGFVTGNDEAKAEDLSKLWVFAGANTEENKNDLWELDFDSQQWVQLTQGGEIPSPRTYHTTTAFLRDKFVVFSGGAKGVEAITDTKTYQLDLLTKEWSILPTRGEPPRPRQGHVLITVDDKLFCHGGMSGMDLYDDLHILQRDGTWTNPEITCSHQPIARAAHGAVCHNRHIYIFGGLGNSGALNDMWRLDVDALTWQEIVVSGSVPPRRLDFTLVLIDLPNKFANQTESQDHGDPEPEDASVTKVENGTEQFIPYILVHGGMDETGQIFDDFYVMCLGTANDELLTDT